MFRETYFVVIICIWFYISSDRIPVEWDKENVIIIIKILKESMEKLYVYEQL